MNVVVSPDALKLFLREHGRVYPYRDVMKTRKRVHVNWLMAERKQHTGHIGRVGAIQMEATTWRILPTNAFHNDTVTHLVVTQQALPVPAHIGEVIEVMESFGRSFDVEWYNRVIDYMGYLLSNGFELSREDIIHHSIELRVDLMVRRHRGDLPFNIVMDDFDGHFKRTYHYGSTKRFMPLCMLMIDYVDARIAQFDTVNSVMSLVNSDPVAPVTPPPY